MTNNTTSYGGDFTIKPLTTSIDIITERQLIASWTRAGLTDGQIRKMLMLYLGVRRAKGLLSVPLATTVFLSVMFRTLLPVLLP